MRFHQLNEYSRQVTATNLGPALIKSASVDDTILVDIDSDDAIDQILSKLESADPTKNKKYSQWIARTYAKGGFKFEDVVSVVSDGLTKFERLRQTNDIYGETADIGKYRNFDLFLDFINSKTEPQKKQKQDRGNYDVEYEDKKVLIIHPKDQTAAIFWGQSTKWCTSSKKNNYFSFYDKKSLFNSGLRVLIPKQPAYKGEKYQFILALDREPDALVLSMKTAADNESSETIDTTKKIAKRFPSVFKNFLLKTLKGHVVWNQEYNTWVSIHMFWATGDFTTWHPESPISNKKEDIDRVRKFLHDIKNRVEAAKKDRGFTIPHATYDFDDISLNTNRFNKYYHKSKKLNETEQLIQEELAQQIYADMRVSRKSQSDILQKTYQSFRESLGSYRELIKHITAGLESEYPNENRKEIDKVKQILKTKLEKNVLNLALNTKNKLANPLSGDTLHVTLFAPQQRNDLGAYDNTHRYNDTIRAILQFCVNKPSIEGKNDSSKPDHQQRFKVVYPLKNSIQIKNWKVARLDKMGHTSIFLVPDNNDPEFINMIKKIRSPLKKAAGAKEYSSGSFIPHIELITFNTNNLDPVVGTQKKFSLPAVKPPATAKAAMAKAMGRPTSTEPTQQFPYDDNTYSSLTGLSTTMGRSASTEPEPQQPPQQQLPYDDDNTYSSLTGLSTRNGSLINKVSRRTINLLIEFLKKNLEGITITFDRIGIQKSSQNMIDVERPEKGENFLGNASVENLKRFAVKNRITGVQYGDNTTLPNGKIVNVGVPGFSENDVRTRVASKYGVKPSDLVVSPGSDYRKPETQSQDFMKFSISDRLNNSYPGKSRIRISLTTNDGMSIPTIFERRGTISGNSPRVKKYDINSGQYYWEPTYVTLYSTPLESNRTLKNVKVNKETDYDSIIGYRYSFRDSGQQGGPLYIFDQKYGWKSARTKNTTNSVQQNISESENSSKFKIFVDMDGVVADLNSDFEKFDNDIKKLAASDPKTIYEFYRNLKPLTDGMKLIKYLQDNNLDFEFLSAPLRKNTKNDDRGSEASKLAKVEWIKHYVPGYENKVLFTSNKSKYAGSNNILIDDRNIFLEPWIQSGGIGIHYKNYNSTIEELKKILSDSYPEDDEFEMKDDEPSYQEILDQIKNLSK